MRENSMETALPADRRVIESTGTETIRTIDLERFGEHLRKQEKSTATIKKYLRDVGRLQKFLEGRPVTKARLIDWKEQLLTLYQAATVNSMLAAANSFLTFRGWEDRKVRPVRIQRDLFCNEGRELTKEEYLRLVRAADSQGNERLSLVLQTICSTGIRVSELRCITVESVCTGRAFVNCKGKTRTVFLTEKLKSMLMRYMRRQKRTIGPVFVTRTGKPLDRSNIWRDMKALCGRAGVSPEKVFPHNLRHLFARVYYTLERDLSRLADILGHSSVSTTRIYTMESGRIHRKQMERMGLIVT